MKRNRESPWNPAESVEVTPEEYERQVVEWLNNTRGSLEKFKVDHLQRIAGAGGEYEIDAVAKFTIFGGATIEVLIECKRHTRPVDRDVVLTLHSKLRDVGAHKGMIFSTSGFQRGAVEYASTYGIATVIFVDGRFQYLAFARNCDPEPPNSIQFPKFAGSLISGENGSIISRLVDDKNLDALAKWLESSLS